MKVQGMYVAGSLNTVKWAIDNKLDLRQDQALIHIIDGEMYFHAVYEQVNEYELFRLTQQYGNKLRVLKFLDNYAPNEAELGQLFPGSIPDSDVTYASVARNAIDAGLALSKQMLADNDIISSNVAEMFAPMIAKRYNIAVPVAVGDVLQALQVGDEIGDNRYNDIFNDNIGYDMIPLGDDYQDPILALLSLGFVRLTQVLKQGDRYDDYLKVVRYSSINDYDEPTIYKYGLNAISRFNNISKTETICSMFNVGDDMDERLKDIKNATQSPLKIELAVQLPISMVQAIEYMMDPNDINIVYPSSSSIMIDEIISFADFKTPACVNDDNKYSEKDQEIVDSFNNRVTAYAIRITDTQAIIKSAIETIIKSTEYYDQGSLFALLQSIHPYRCVLDINTESLQKTNILGDPILDDLFAEIDSMVDGIKTEIANAK